MEKLYYSKADRAVRKILDNITPMILKRYKLKDKLNNPELDRIARQELKREYLRLIESKNDYYAAIAKEMIQENPRFMFAGISPWIYIAIKGPNSFDYMLYTDDETRKGSVFWAVVGRDTVENRKIACDFYGIEYFSET